MMDTVTGIVVVSCLALQGISYVLMARRMAGLAFQPEPLGWRVRTTFLARFCAVTALVLLVFGVLGLLVHEAWQP